MRIGAFEIDCQFNACFVLAEISCGQARLLRSFRVRNVRGDAGDWLRVYAEVNGERTRVRSLRELAVGDETRAALLEQGVREALIAPRGLGPGRYACRLVIVEAGGEEELPFAIEVLDARVIPNDFVRARLLPAYLREDDELRGFASDGQPAAGAFDDLRRLYDALLERQLDYQPPVSAAYPDCQRVSDMAYVLRRGGSCADLSLLLASLLWCRGHSPALLLLDGREDGRVLGAHMAAGCFADDALPEFETLDGGPEIARLIRAGALTLVETTAMCGYRLERFAGAARDIAERLAAGGEACRLVNVARILRNGGVRLLPGAEDAGAAARCPHCGYDRLSPAMVRAGGECPACGRPLTAGAPETPSADEAPEVVGGGVLQYGVRGTAAVVLRLLQTDAEAVRVAPVWQGREVRGIGERAMQHSGVQRVFLPEGIARIDGYAFHDCAALTHIALPEALTELGAGAFSGSGLLSVSVPGGVARVPRMAFASCGALERVELAEGIETIGERAFAGCPALRSVRIPASVKRIQRDAFDPGCALILLSGKTVVER